ncbi:MAG: chromosome segregation protein SMC [Lachnospiraceae bacterium]|nr:chromosome segregation protein SMC [Lachnospiraceae bacterium]
MYLKSIEMYGFKSFANKIVFDFHNGITGIVGPNGSGKSNVSDAVRWVLGEQSAKQLRGASMQDVIFAGTENRKPLSYAYVAITMDNSDHLLPIDYEEVTIARRVYRSGESEYLLNGSPCRLKDVNELFYDTGIGKEGYSIIGQGQIEKILSGKPEERRELFDEAVGIVKFKKRKAATVKKLEHERENLVRINDILSELERQIGPLERQSEVARNYLKKKEELKTLEVNAFLMEIQEMNQKLDEIKKNYDISQGQMNESKELQDKVKEQYTQMEENLSQMDAKIESIREEQSNTTLMKGKLENQINLLEEQIRFAENADENLAERKGALEAEKKEYLSQKETYEAEKAELEVLLAEVEERLNSVRKFNDDLQAEIKGYNDGIEQNNAFIMELLNNKAAIQSKEQRFDTMLEQTNIRKAQLNQRLLQRKTEEEQLGAGLLQCQKEYEEACARQSALKEKEKEFMHKSVEWKNKLRQATEEQQEKRSEQNKLSSRLEALRNIAERYDGYGNSIRKVMEQKDREPGIIGVVSDLIHVDKKYEVAIETALSGNIQNIVTKDEATAKKMISYLKENHLGRATFLPLTSVSGKGFQKDRSILNANGVLGLANELVDADDKYAEVLSYLLGRVIVVDHIDNGIALAKANHYSLHIVTLEGEYFSPGGSLSGGTFKNNSNLLGRNREIEELEKKLAALSEGIKKGQERIGEIETAMALLESDRDENRLAIEENALACNTAQIHLQRAQEQKSESENAFASLNTESDELERQIRDIVAGKKEIALEREQATLKEEELKQQTEEFQKLLDEKMYMESSAARNVSEAQIEEANARQKVTFVQENCRRVEAEIEKKETDILRLIEEAKTSKEDAAKKRSDIEEIKKTIMASDDNFAGLENALKEAVAQKESMNQEYKDFFKQREEISDRIAQLDKEIYRLETQREKLEQAVNYQTTYMWEEYELTLRSAEKLRDPAFDSLDEMRKSTTAIKDEIRRMGNVNVNAIEEYKEVSERYNFLKGQHDDLVEAEQTLMGIIDDLDEGMRKQFTEGFADIQREFDKAFKELFGGGKGTLELVEGEDILETGIRIIAQPPGKKLQNMMQLSGGEKSLTAIALLFAIQNLKPSPFCLLDEIEAALDDSNVGRFAKYLHKLTKNTQFIIITHRRGTMNSADRLYGITMQEKGVSTLVSVNLIENDLDE